MTKLQLRIEALAYLDDPQPSRLTLPLLMLRVRTANHTHNTVALNNFTATANPLDGCTNFHFITPLIANLKIGLTTITFKISFFKNRLILIRHQMGLHLRHEIHDYHYHNK